MFFVGYDMDDCNMGVGSDVLASTVAWPIYTGAAGIPGNLT